MFREKNRATGIAFIWQFIALLSLAMLPHMAQAQYAATATGQITFIENGWGGEGFAIHMENSVQTAGCPAPPYEYGVDASHQAYKILVALMITAYTQKLPVQMVVEPGVCVLGARTKVISIRLRN